MEALKDDPGFDTKADALRIIRMREVLAICGKSRSSIYELIHQGRFPAPVKLGGRSSGWVKSEVLKWIEERIKDR